MVRVGLNAINLLGRLLFQKAVDAIAGEKPEGDDSVWLFYTNL